MSFNKDFKDQIVCENNDYSCPDEMEHARKNSDMFVGNPQIGPMDCSIIDFEKSTRTKPVTTNVTLRESDARMRIFLEALTNATDNAFKTVRMRNIDPDTKKLKDPKHWVDAEVGDIVINMTETSIEIINGGQPMPIVVRQEESSKDLLMTIPKFLASKMRAGSNNDKDNTSYSCGKNAVGLKTIGIMSDRYIIKVCDNIRGQRIMMEWKKRLTINTPDIIEPGFKWNDRTKQWDSKATKTNHYEGPNIYSIYWEPTTELSEWGRYSLENMGCYAKILIDMSYICKVPVKFTCEFKKKKYTVENKHKDFLSYFSVVKPSITPKNKLSHIVWHNKLTSATGNDSSKVYSGKSIAEQIRIAANPKTADDYPMFEIYLYDTPKNGGIYSFVNGLETFEGGIHVDTVLAAIKKSIKVPQKAAGVKNISSILTTQITNNITIIVSVRLKNAAFGGQTKKKLCTHMPGVTSLAKFPNFNFELTSELNEWVGMEEIMDHMNSLGGVAKKVKEQKVVACKNLVDATKAGGKDSEKCTLYLVEGNTAKSYPSTRIDHSEGGRLYGGYLPLRGKLRNVSKSSQEGFDESPVIKTILKTLGLNNQTSDGLGLDFNDPKNRKVLRYGKIVIVTDADTDGYHILCLLINFFSQKYPTMITSNMISYLRTPVIRIFKKEKKDKKAEYGDFVKALYDMKEFKTYIDEQPSNFSSKHEIIYYKGLGTSTPDDVIQDIDFAWDIRMVDDKFCYETLETAFGKFSADKRKDWINENTIKNEVSINHRGVAPMLKYSRDISNVIRNELLTYYFDSIVRAIPSALDGWKESQRQALWYILVNWNYGLSKQGFSKVSVIANAASGFTKYTHGEKSMTMTIINMAQCFIGGKNMNLFAQYGQFGTRNENGQDVSESTGRYCKAKCAWWTNYSFKQGMVECVEKRLVEGDPVEPLYIPSVIPWHVINGVLGIATGYSTRIPAHCPFDVVNWLLTRCKGVNPNDIFRIKPYYCGHLGKIKIYDVDNHIDIDNMTDLPAGDRDAKLGDFLKETDKMSSRDDESEDKTVESDRTGWEEDEEDDETDTETLSGSVASSNCYRSKPKGRKPRMYSCGICTHQEKSNGLINISISELPLGLCINKYKENVLNKWILSKNISGFDDYGKGQVIDLRIYDFDTKKIPYDLHTLKLTRPFPLGNMNLSIADNTDPENPKHRAIRFNNAGEILEVYYRNMVKVYGKLIKRNLAEKEAVHDKLDQKLRLIRMFLDGKLRIPSRGKPVKKEEWYKKTDKENILRKIVNDLGMVELAEENADALIAKIEEILKEIEEIKLHVPEKLYMADLSDFKTKVLNSITIKDDLLSIAHKKTPGQVEFMDGCSNY